MAIVFDFLLGRLRTKDSSSTPTPSPTEKSIAASGTNNYTTAAGLTSLDVGTEVSLILQNANTGACTADLGFGPLPLTKFGTNPFESEDISNGQILDFRFDGTNLQCISPLGRTFAL